MLKPQSLPPPAAFTRYKLVLFLELLCSPLLDGLFDRAQRAVQVGASAAGGPVVFREKKHEA